jgi:ABC-type transporter Mla subunit MlaD
MHRNPLVAALIAALAALAPGCGDAEDLTAEQRQAYRQVVAYREDPEAVLLRSYDYQQAAAKQYTRNLRTLQQADLDEDDAIGTLKTCTLEITDGSKPGTDPKACEAALDAVRAAVDQRLGEG